MNKSEQTWKQCGEGKGGGGEVMKGENVEKIRTEMLWFIRSCKLLHEI